MRKSLSGISNAKSKQLFNKPTNIPHENIPQQFLQISPLSAIIEIPNDEEDSRNEKTRSPINASDNDDGDNDDKLLLHSANSELEDITIVDNDHNSDGTKIRINSLPSSLKYQHQLTSKIQSVNSNQENEDEISDLTHKDELYPKIEQQHIPEINENNIHQTQHLSDIANYLTENRRIAIGDTKDSKSEQIHGILHDQKVIKEDEASKISIIENERIKLTVATITTMTTTVTTATIATTSKPLITGYPDETTGSTRSRFIYVTKRPKPL
ncbi:hypothetical protein WUBG_06333 [Wuchereria bancrofti]|nr:hypothetical protein WUBG_06333 [Wuchereria bancrofti]